MDGKHVKKSKVVCEPGKPILTEEEQKIWADWLSVSAATTVENLIQAYARDVMSPLLGSELVDPGVVIRVSSEFLEKVSHNVHNARPAWRVDASQIDIGGRHALLISDHSLFRPLADLVCSGAEQEESSFPSISVEIKVNAISHYSPLDLFSENLEKINQAVHNLFDNPQNNLRVFVGGSLVDMTMSNLNESANGQVLREALEDCFCSENQDDPVEVLKELVSQSLYETDALKNLLAAQKLDTCDIEGAIHAYHKLRDSCPAGCLNTSMMNTLDENIHHKAGGFLDCKNLAESRRIVRDFLIAATAKDCSLMLTFEQAPDIIRENVNMQCHKLVWSSKIHKFFRLKINFVDLDLKPLCKMPHYLHIDQEIVRAYVTATNGGTKCCEVHEQC